MGSHEDAISLLEAALAPMQRVFAGLSDDEWRLPAKLVPVDADVPHWTVFELARHFDISIGLTRMLIAGREASPPARDRTSFFINPGSETAPVVYGYAYKMVQGKTPRTCRACCGRRSPRRSPTRGPSRRARWGRGALRRCVLMSSWAPASWRP